MLELGVRPSGGVYCFSQKPCSDALLKLECAFNLDVGAGMLALATTKPTAEFGPSLRYWRKIASHCLHQRCHQQADECVPLGLPDEGSMADFLLAAPPMRGAEYITAGVLARVWQSMDRWLCQRVHQDYKGVFARFLQTEAPHWHQVGRVCFHLAENKQDELYPFAFMATYAAALAESGRVRFQPLGKALKEYAGAKNKPALIQLLSPIDLAAKHSSDVQQWLSSGEIFAPQAWTANEAYSFIQQVPLFEDSGIIVRLPDWWKKRAKPQVEVNIGTKKLHNLGADALLDFEVHGVLEGKRLTEKEWQALLNAEDNLILFKGQWVEVDREKLSQALQHWQTVESKVAQEGISFAQGMRLLSGLPDQIGGEQEGSAQLAMGTAHWSFVNAGKSLQAILQDMRHPESVKKATPGKKLKATLRPYQVIGVNWLHRLSSLGLGACLADDMGLGKTIQVIALLLTQLRSSTKEQGQAPSLLVLPASLMNNWKSEVKKFAPSLNCYFVHPAFLSVEQMAVSAAPAAVDVVITTYGMLSRQSWIQEQLWQFVILDEAQAIKNANTKQAKAVKKLKAHARIALTGTPVENRLSDLWSLFDFLNPGLLGNASAFKKMVKTLEKNASNPYGPLRKLVSPYILRRLKSDKKLIADLPDKTELHAYCNLSGRQAVLYEKSVKELQRALEKGAQQQNAEIKRRGLVLSYLLRFKQICNHPSQYLGDGEYKPEASGKFGRLAELAEEISARQEKLLVFSQFREMTQVLADFLEPLFGRAGLVLHGGTSIPKRKEYVEAFQREDGPPFFVLSIKAGGTGLNLTAASHVVHFDRWWNPAVENQATDRAYRIGQKRNVLVHKFVCKGTVEEKIDAIIQEKSHLSEELLGAGAAEKRLTELSDTDLIKLVSLDLKQLT